MKKSTILISAILASAVMCGNKAEAQVIGYSLQPANVYYAPAAAYYPYAAPVVYHDTPAHYARPHRRSSCRSTCGNAYHAFYAKRPPRHYYVTGYDPALYPYHAYNVGYSYAY